MNVGNGTKGDKDKAHEIQRSSNEIPGNNKSFPVSRTIYKKRKCVKCLDLVLSPGKN